MDNYLLCLPKKMIKIMLTADNQTTPQHVMKQQNGQYYLTTDNSQTNTGCAKFMERMFKIEYD